MNRRKFLELLGITTVAILVGCHHCDVVYGHPTTEQNGVYLRWIVYRDGKQLFWTTSEDTARAGVYECPERITKDMVLHGWPK